MASQVFYRKWRPQTLAEVVGQEQVTKTLLNALASGRVSHAYLFCGPRGTGKTSTGRILAKAVNCLTNDGRGEPCNNCPMCQDITEGRALDIIEVDAASNRGIDEIRGLREKVTYAPAQARYKVYIIDEVHMLTKEASNALLKTLEEPPPHVIFVLATTEAHKVLPTILSRCQHFDFRRIAQADVVAKLTHVSKQEGINIEPEALRLIAKATTGSLRDAENLLQQLTTYYGAEIELKQVQTILGVTGDRRAKDLAKHIVNNDITAGIATINSANADGLDLRQFTRELVEYLRILLLIKTGSEGAVDLTTEEIKELKDVATKASLPQILRAVKLFGQLDLGLDNYSTLPLELALVDCVLPPVVEEKTVEVVEPAAKEYKAPPVRVENKPAAKQPVKTATQPVTPPPAKQPVAKAEPVKTPEPAPVTEGAAPSAPESITGIERLRLNWRQFLKEAPESVSRTPAAALLRSARPKTMEGNVIVLSFKYPLHKENMEKLENQKIAEQILSNFLGQACRLRCVYEPEDHHLVRAAMQIGAQIIDVEEK